ncbi:MAG: magnesium transporter CorA family protein [Candidatus Pacebacteria bacterium]|nr:magnesium transporter CorA family protein [Candidatus Paceibacterota bacterium]
MINIYKKTLKSPQIREVKEIEPGTWIRVIDPSKDELSLLSKKMKLDLSILEDGLDENEISRLEKEDGALYMIIRFPTRKNFIMTVPILVIITDENIVTICKEKEQLTKYFIEGDKDFLTTKKTYFVLKIVSEIFKSYDTYLNRILKDIKLKKIQIDNLKNRDILFLVQEEETLNDFISSLVPAINITEKILRGKYINIYDRDEDIIEDLVLDSKQTLELSRNGLKSIKNIREAYSTILTNDLNRVMKILTITTIILTVPTIISSIFGMNIPLPLANNPMAFFYIMSLTIVLSIILLVIIIKRRWV